MARPTPREEHDPLYTSQDSPYLRTKHLAIEWCADRFEEWFSHIWNDTWYDPLEDPQEAVDRYTETLEANPQLAISMFGAGAWDPPHLYDEWYHTDTELDAP